MNQYLELNAMWAKYIPLSIEALNYESIVARFDVGHLDTAEKIDAYVVEMSRRILDELQDEGFDLKYLEPLFIKKNAFAKADAITSETDLEIVRSFDADFECEAANTYAKIEIDFYYLERFLRTRGHGEFPVYGNIEKELFDRHFNIESLVRNSIYYKELKGLTVRNFESKFDAYRITAMRNYLGVARGVNGIVAKVYFKLMDLQNIRIVLKGHLYGLDVSKIVRDVNA
jgi:hypothetical protein